MLNVLCILTRDMRVRHAGPNPPATPEALLAATLAAASPPHRAIAGSTHTFGKYLTELSTAVHTGKKYSEVAPPPKNAEVRDMLDAATLYVAPAAEA